MFDSHAVATIAALYVVAIVVPGANFVAITHRAMTSPRSQALALAGGIVLVNLVWASSAMLGVTAVFAVFPWLALAAKLAGAAYLIWFGARLLLRAGTGTSAARSTDAPASGVLRAFGRGVAVNLVNPKSIAFYAAVFSAAAPPHVDRPTFVAILACVASLATLWYGSVALFFSHPLVSRWFERRARPFDRVCGSVLIALGIRQGAGAA